MDLIVLALLAASLSLALTFLLIRTAHRLNIVDVPNARSSHALPTPRGGGVAVFVVFIAAAVSLATDPARIQLPLLLALLAGGTAVAGVGLLDDWRDVPPWFRILIHAGAVIWALSCLDAGTVNASLGSFTGTFVMLVVGVALVWLINLYNFMTEIHVAL